MEFYEKGLLLFTFFLHSSSICSCHLFSISSASLRLNLVLSISLVFDVTVNRIVLFLFQIIC